MLVLSRRVNEQIVIDGNTFITIISIHGDKVRIGIEAPKAISVHREEVQKAIEKKENNDGPV